MKIALKGTYVFYRDWETEVAWMLKQLTKLVFLSFFLECVDFYKCNFTSKIILFNYYTTMILEVYGYI
jgi:hypothetical protein